MTGNMLSTRVFLTPFPNLPDRGRVREMLAACCLQYLPASSWHTQSSVDGMMALDRGPSAAVSACEDLREG